MTPDSLREKARAVAAKCYGNKLSEIEAVVLEFGKEVAEEAVKEARKKFDRELAGEMRDPNGTIWECAAAEKKRADDAEARLLAFTSATPDSPEVKAAMAHAENGAWEGRFCHPFCKQCRGVLARAFRAAQVRIRELEAKVSMNKSIADAALQRADESHGERADVLLRLSTETSNRVFTDSELVKLEVRAESAESALAAAQAKLAEAEISEARTLSEYEREKENGSFQTERADAAQAKLAEAEKRLEATSREIVRQEHSVYWYGSRFATLRDWARGMDEKHWTEFNCIVANGSKDIGTADLHSRNFNQLKYRAEAAEAKLADQSSVIIELGAKLNATKLREEGLEAEAATLNAALGRAREALKHYAVHGTMVYTPSDSNEREAVDDTRKAKEALAALPPLPADAKGEK